jgi:hypothetical protein
MWLNFDILNQFGRNVVVPANKAPKKIVFVWKKILIWVSSYRTVHFEERNSCKLICKNTSFYIEEIWSLMTSINILINEGSNDMSILKELSMTISLTDLGQDLTYFSNHEAENKKIFASHQYIGVLVD